MKKVCINCAARIEYETEYDNGFYYEYGLVRDWHESVERVYQCENGCESTSFVEVESDLGRRFYRRFKAKPKTDQILIIMR